MEDNNNEEVVSKWTFDKAMMHLNFGNKRLLIALISVCVTFILTIVIFVFGYTVREKNWLDTIKQIQTPAETEVDNGTQQNGNH